ncbi:sulfurtransferase TusA family protein [Moraxella nasibovis]|uniref:sulfurtransferase TusA family protein n=1 Tax=Moraxella nasibovis TaxID=2904120 RepID=UPI00240F5178|nr:sulfurtransferase TusA family protein [Moraxella nasibovis]WFF38073.1 sulfurtransferase TusA family protein [Moraxella nasibovis]
MTARTTSFHLTISDALSDKLGDDDIALIHESIRDKFVSQDQVLGAYFDARGMPCPMPLLKAKIALRSVADGESLYLVASDKNSQTDLVAFCQKQGHEVVTWQSDTQPHNTENFFHFIITKKASV